MSITEIGYTTGIALLMSWLILRWRPMQLKSIHRRWVLGAFWMKIMAGLFMTFIYTRYYPDRSKADIFKYFDDSEVMYESLQSNPTDYLRMVSGINNDNKRFDTLYYSKMNNWYRKYETVTYNDSHTIIRINALIRLFSFGYFQVHNLIFIILSFIGFLALYKAFCRYFADRLPWLFAALFLIPSVVFWSSGAMKESILFLGIGVFLYAFQSLIFIGISVKRILLIIASAALLVFTKMYVFAILIPFLTANLWIVLSNNRRALLKYLISFLTFLNLAILLGHIFPELNVFALFVGKQHDFIGLATHEGAGSFIAPLPVEANFMSFLTYTPQAIVNTLFRPWPTEVNSLLMIPSVIENFVLLLLIILSVLTFKGKEKPWRIIWLCLLFSLVLSALTGITTPVLGALVRYRVPILPFLYMALFLIIDFEIIKHWLHSKKHVNHV